VPSVQFQILSDLHLEINVDNKFERNPSDERKIELLQKMQHPDHLPPFEVAAPYLVLLGDIGYPSTWIYKHFLLMQAERYQKVIVLTGNHEYYSTPRWKTHFEEVEFEIRSLCAEHPNLIFLNQDSILLDGLRILGTTLWEAGNFSSNDAAKIYNQEGKTVQYKEFAYRHQEERKWIEIQLALAQQNKETVVILTHHSPSLSCSQLLFPPVAAWLYGHTHRSQRITQREIIIASNQLGYVQMGEKDPKFHSECVVEFNMETGKCQIIRESSHYRQVLIEKEKEEAEKLRNFVPKAAPPPPLLPKKKM